MNVFTTHDKVGEIVARMPRASEVFKRYSVDFCCGGHRPLAEAVSEANADEGAVLAELETAYADMQSKKELHRDWRTAPVGELVEHIVDTHHTYLQRVLPELSHLTTTVLRAHGANHPELSRVHKLFHMLKMELDGHLITEEEVLFPIILKYAETGSHEHLQKSVSTVEQLEDEHETAGGVLKELRQITNQYTVPDDACGTYARMYELMQELEADVFEHIHLENNILHKRLMQELGH